MCQIKTKKKNAMKELISDITLTYSIKKFTSGIKKIIDLIMKLKKYDLIKKKKKSEPPSRQKQKQFLYLFKTIFFIVI